MKTSKFKINGLHCQSCKIVIEEDLKDLPGINNINVDYQTELAEVIFDDQLVSQEQIFSRIKKLNYQPVDMNSQNEIIPPQRRKNPAIYWILAAIFLIGVYILIRYSGGFQLLSLLSGGYQLGYGIIFLIGLMAGFHCIGMCGSIVVSYSTLCLETNKKSFWPHWQYNLGRIISYTVIGAILGGFGAFFGINPTLNGIVTILAGVFMLFLGLSLVSKWSILEKLKLKTPQFIAKYIFSQKNKKSAPFIIGLLNGFMPCGPLQAMQLYALTSGNAIHGAFSLFAYALGTSILMFTFGAFLNFISQKQIKNILKLSGLLVIILALLMILRGLTNFGINLNWLSFNHQSSVTQNISGQIQEVNMSVTYYGYEPNILYIKKGIPVRWTIDVKQLSGCNSTILLLDYNIKQALQIGKNIIEFTPTKSGEIKFSCGMQMIWGKFIVSDNNITTSNANNLASNNGTQIGDKTAAPAGCGCGASIKKVNDNQTKAQSCH